MDHAAAEHLRKTVTGVCMIGAPVAFFVSDLLFPVTHTKAADVLRDATGATGRVYAAGLFVVLGMILFAGAVLGLAHLLHERRPGMAMVGGGVTLIGIIGVSALVGAQTLFLTEAARASRDVAAMTDVGDAMFTAAIPFIVLTLGTLVGMVILAVGLYRAKVVPSWAAICLGVAAVGVNIGNSLALKPLLYAAELVLLAGLGSIGWEVLTETDEEWEHTPEFHGFGRPVTA